MKKLYKLTLLLIALACSTSLTFGQTPTPPTLGDGTSGNPYQIATLDNLYWLSQNNTAWAAGLYFIQTADIDASSTSGWVAGAGWTPIGNASIKFKGNYNGQNHTIDGLFINRPSENNMSLFGLAVGAVFENISATNVNFTGLQMVAGLVAQIDVSSTVNNCSTTGTVTVTGSTYAGGLVAYSISSIISNSHSSCSVTGISYTGGLIGLLFYSNASDSYATGSVTATAGYIGGFVGSNSYFSTISMCYATGSVSGGATGAYVGGFAGSNESGNSISNCFAIGSVTGTNQRLGGLTGLNAGTVSNCFASGSVTPGIQWSGGLNGASTGTKTTNSFWDTQTSGYATSTYGGTGKTTAEMKTQSTFTDATWDFTEGTGIWAMSSTITFGGYPTLQWTNSYATAPSSNEIATLSNLVWVAESSTRWAASYTQTADIDASATSGWDGGAGWTPIGNSTIYFTGSYDGQGHTINGLYINRPSTDDIGLFGYSLGSGTIQNLGVTNVNITGYGNVGGLLGHNYNSSEISNCYCTGSVSGYNIVGGLVGYNYNATVSKCYSNCIVNGESDIGGLVGYNRNLNISNCYSTGSVSGIYEVGGLVGFNRGSAVVSNSYSTGSVNGTVSDFGGLVGLNLGSVTNSFWDTETSGQATSSGGTGKTTVEMKTLSTFTNPGWDFGTIWSLSSGYNSGYPNLDGEGTVDFTWDGSESTAWNTAANWDVNAVPGVGDNVVIPGSLTNYPVIAYGENGSCNDLAINSGGELKVDHGGSLITNGNITNNGTFAIDLLISQNKWHMVSSPITGATANTFLGDYLQNWDEPTATWSDITDPATALAPTKGYSLWDALKFGDTYTFTGTPNTGNQNDAITYTNHGGTTYDGANLLGNPYPSSIDWSGLDDTYGAVYYWDGSAYVSWNNGSGSGVQYIPPMQGFFVVAAASGTFNLTNNNRTHSGAASYYKSSGSISNGLVLEATGDTYNDELYLKLNEEAASGFELTRDAWKLPSNTPGISQLWSVCPEGNLSIDVRPYQEVVPLGFSNDVAGNYGISIKEMADLTSVILEDTKENTFTDLTKGAYHFKWDLTDDENRFKIHLGITGIQTPSQAESVLIYASGQDLYLRPVEGQSNGTLTLTDMAGRSVFQKQVQVSGLTSVPVNLVSGIYLVSFRTNTETLVKKVVIQ